MKRSFLYLATAAMLLIVSAPVAAFALTADTSDEPAALVQDGTQGEEAHADEPAGDRSGTVGYGLAALAAALAVGLAAIGTGYAQAKIGTAGGGALAERPELAGTMIILVAIPETAVILGFVIAFFLQGLL